MLTLLSIMMSFPALAAEFQPPELPHHLGISEGYALHGPDGPPPDDGYEFEDDSDGGNFLGKLGLTLLVASALSGGVYLLTEGETKENAGAAAVYMGSAGAGFFAIELVF